MQIIFFGSQNCGHCIQVLSQLMSSSDFVHKDKVIFIDANDQDEICQQFCDLHQVTVFPHIKVIIGDQVIYNQAGDKVSSAAIIQKLRNIKI